MNKYITIKTLNKAYQIKEGLEDDYYAFLLHFNKGHVAQHCKEVAEEAGKLARLFGYSEHKARLAASYHDISAVIPGNERIAFAEATGVDVLEEERQLPLIIHQKLSVVIAKEIFNIRDQEVLQAIGRHTTLHPEYTPYDMIVFIADKLRWDQNGKPPFYESVAAGLEHSLERGCLAYLDYLLHEDEGLVVVHPWAKKSFQRLQYKELTK